MNYYPPYPRLPHLRLRNVKVGEGTTYCTRASYFTWVLLLSFTVLGAAAGYLIYAFTKAFDFTKTAIMYTLIGALAGLVFGIIISIIACCCASSADKKAKEEFTPVRTSLSSVRKIVCESRSATLDNYATVFLGDYAYKRGRLFLTYDALEFYDEQFELDYKNFLINVHDICVVKPGSMYKNRVILYTRSGKHFN